MDKQFQFKETVFYYVFIGNTLWNVVASIVLDNTQMALNDQY